MPDYPPSLRRGGLWLVPLFAGLLSSSIADTPLNTLQKAASDWAKLRSETSRLEKNWLSEKQVLAATVNGLNLQGEQLRVERDTLQAETAAEREELAAMKAENEATAARIAEAGERVTALSERLLALRPALPPRLAKALDLSFRTIAGDELPPAERMRHNMSILNRCNQFNQTFVLAEEITTVRDGEDPRLLEVIYWGLAQACALDRSQGEAFIGRPVNGTWEWEAAPDFVDEAERLIAVHEDESEPVFVDLPVQIQQTGGAE